MEGADCLFPDDREENVEGAKKAGLRAVRVPNPGAAQGLLREHLRQGGFGTNDGRLLSVSDPDLAEPADLLGNARKEFARRSEVDHVDRAPS